MNNDVLYRVAKKIAEKDNFLDTDSVYNRIKKLAIAIEDDEQLSFSMMHYSENEIADFFDIPESVKLSYFLRELLSIDIVHYFTTNLNA